MGLGNHEAHEEHEKKQGQKLISQIKKMDGFTKVKVSRWSLQLNRRFPISFAGACVPEGDTFNGVRGPFERIAASKFARVYKGAINFKDRKYNVYIKQYLCRSPVDFLKHLVRLSRAERSFNAAMMLAEHGLSSPEVIVMGCLRFGPVTFKNFLITSDLENAKPVYILLTESLNNTDKRAFLAALGTTIGKMHAANIFHGDLRPGNVLAERKDDKWQFHFLDNERTRKFQSLPDRRRLKNLTQINMLANTILAKTDRMRFYKSYIKQTPNLTPRRKTIALATAANTRKRMTGKIPQEQI